MKLKLRLLIYTVLIAATTGGFVLGVGGRLLMRGIARMAGSSGGFSWGGTLEIIALGALIGIVSGLFYGLFLKFFQKSPLLLGLLFGILCYAAIILLPIDGKGAINGFPQFRSQILILFGTLFLLYGLMTALVIKVLLRSNK